MKKADASNKNELSFSKKLWRTLRALLLIGAACIAAFLLFFSVKLLNLDSWNDFDPNRILSAPQTLILYDKDNNEAIRLHASEDRVYIPIKEIPDHVQKAFISAEDARFYKHNGVDFIRVMGALWTDIKAMRYVQGASTITQQLIKLSHLTPEKTMARKLEEAVLAMQMERLYSKDQILEMYLNYVYFGAGCYGIEAAALNYFGVSAKELTVAQAADLAGILKSPSNYAPHIDREASTKRRNNVIRLMYEYGYISDQQREEATAEPLVLVEKQPQHRGYYIDAALDEACGKLNITLEELLCGGYRVYTSMDSELQKLSEQTLNDSSLFPENSDGCQAAIAIVEPDTGFVLAMVGGRGEAGAMAFNRAADIRRQPGSLIKPVIVYAPALESLNYTAATMLLDEPMDFNGYSPQNAGGRHYGWVTLRDAVKRSLNVPAVKVLSELGVERGKEFAKSLGIEFDESDTSLTLALGGFSYGVSPLQMAEAYAAFASGGIYREASLVVTITDAYGNTLYQHKDEGKRVMSEGNAYILTSMLESVVNEGTGKRLKELDMELAGKTGTVDQDEGNRDAWMAVYNKEYSACVWMGYDSAREGSLPADANGGKYPAFILHRLFSSIYAEKQAPVFSMPEGVETVKLDGYTLSSEHKAVLANAFTPKDSIVNEVFLAKDVPDETTLYWSVPKAPRSIGVELNEEGYPVIRFMTSQRGMDYCVYRLNYGQPTLLARLNGDGELSYADYSASNGANYYYVVAEHPKLSIAGHAAQGVPTRTVSIMVDRASYQNENGVIPEILLEDTEFDDE